MFSVVIIIEYSRQITILYIYILYIYILLIYILYISYCSYKTDSEKHFVDMKSWFQARGYPNDLVQMEMNEIKFSGYWDKNKTNKKSKRVPLVITFHLLLKGCGIIIRKNLYLLC